MGDKGEQMIYGPRVRKDRTRWEKMGEKQAENVISGRTNGKGSSKGHVDYERA